MKIVFADARTLTEVEAFNELKRLGDLQVYDQTLPEEKLARLKDAEIIITNKVVIDRKTIDHCQNLKLICVAATGMNNIDLDYAREKNIVVKNVKGYSTDSVAQHTFALILTLINKIVYYNDYVKEGRYSHNDFFTHLGRPFNNLAGKTFGIVGLGAIGRKVAEIAAAFGCEVIYYSASGNRYDVSYKVVSFDQLLNQSDIISIHASLSDKTINLFNKQAFSKMKEHAILVNTGRGGIVNEEALADALEQNKISGAALDVFEKEPLPINSQLLPVSDKKLILTPHIAWGSIEARNNLVKGIVENIADFVRLNR